LDYPPPFIYRQKTAAPQCSYIVDRVFFLAVSKHPKSGERYTTNEIDLGDDRKAEARSADRRGIPTCGNALYGIGISSREFFQDPNWEGLNPEESRDHA
jgi:hypothetical protein